MTITKEQSAEMLEAAKPLMKWLNKNAHPHTQIVVEHADVFLLEGIAHERTLEFTKSSKPITPLNQVQGEIINQLCHVVAVLGSKNEVGLLAAIGSLGDTLSDEDVLNLLKEWNNSHPQSA